MSLTTTGQQNVSQFSRFCDISGPKRGFGASFQEDAQRNLALPAQAIDILGVEVSAAVQSDEFAPEHLDVRIEHDCCLITVDCHGVHGSITKLIRGVLSVRWNLTVRR